MGQICGIAVGGVVGGGRESARDDDVGGGAGAGTGDEPVPDWLGGEAGEVLVSGRVSGNVTAARRDKARPAGHVQAEADHATPSG